ncbi:MAG: hypothetical protein J1E99_07435 [Muribaculaceae bacterium]|nr:hypothetical protein [Muribaculaceae bacterium]
MSWSTYGTPDLGSLEVPARLRAGLTLFSGDATTSTLLSYTGASRPYTDG